ncbi:disulfide bond formation protein B, partial [candidate division WWE3 bacterium]|nr:disulfide bond formation protein B [candidate division WWE3 bacterium]
MNTSNYFKMIGIIVTMLAEKITPKLYYYLAWLQALVASVVSLYFSEILHWPPCTLCWYQRIFMYPLVMIIPLGIMRKDSRLYTY